MKELAQRFIGKKCNVYCFDGNLDYKVIIKEVTDGGLLVEEKNGQLKALNLNFVRTIEERIDKKKKDTDQ